MRAVAAAVLVALFTLGLVSSGEAAPAVRAVVVVLRDNVSSARVASEHAAAHGADVSHVYEYALKGYAARVPEQRLPALRNDPRVLWVEDDRIFSINDEPAYETGVDRIESDQNSGGAGGANGTVTTVIAVLDTGVSHSDVNVVRRFNCTGRGPLNSSCKEGSGSDGHGHGTHVAGTAAAKKNGSFVIGVAPGAPVWSIKVLGDNGSGYTSWIVAGINVTAQYSGTVGVANMSLGGSGSDDGNCGNSNNDSMHKAICGATGKGVVYVVAAGNSAADAKNYVPASYDEAITVSAVADFNGKGGGGAPATCRADADESFADFSNFGADVDIAAPGVCIKSLWKNESTYVASGTSMASPHVAGVAAMYVQRNGKPINATGVQAVRAALVAAGYPQADPDCGFTGDPDGAAEPLVDANDASVGGSGTACETTPAP